MPDQIVVTNVFASQSGNVPVSQLDTDLTAVAKQLNVSSVRNLVGNNTPATPNTKFDYSADAVVLRNTTTFQTAIVTNTGTLTNDTAVAGSAANGRDQAAAFGASQFIHFYFIWNGSTLSTLSSLTAPPTGPALPTGYTHWAYAGAIYYNATPLLVKTRMRGAWMDYETAQSALAIGAATVETAVSLTTLVPPNALQMRLSITFISFRISNNTTGGNNLRPRAVTGAAYVARHPIVARFPAATAATQQFPGGEAILPNIGQQFFYIQTAAGGSDTPTTTIDVTGYSVPNGEGG